MEITDQETSIKKIYRKGELFTLGNQDGIFGIQTILSSLYVPKFHLLFRGEWNKTKRKEISIIAKNLMEGSSYGKSKRFYGF